MDPPRSSALSSRSSRRSFPNLHHLSLAPLSSKYPLDASSPASPSEDPETAPRTSYIQGKSAPATPGILSLSQSRSPSRHGRSYVYDGYFLSANTPSHDLGAIPKAKSSSALLAAPAQQQQQQQQQHSRRTVTPAPLRLRLPRRATDDSTTTTTTTTTTAAPAAADDEWLYRAGLAIAGETRESKGQSWLVRRASSTSLVLPDDHDHDRDHGHSHSHSHSHNQHHSLALLSGEHFADDEYSPVTPRWGSRAGSRVGSRVVSARTSRRGSRVGSRVELMTTTTAAAAAAAVGQRTPLAGLEDGYFGEQVGVEPDFVEPDDELVGDEEEVARLARERGFGLGGWMDRLIGWTLFRVEEDGEESEDEEDGVEREESLTEQEMQLRREVEARRRKLDREMILRASAAGPNELGAKSDTKESTETQAAASDGEGGWQDAAWLLSVASKVLL
ncbi:hypothetical protein AOQ84DRAFT_419449 [Glonium stellatum]|uniref:Uncharacterized protein n=1 Tax=Glonium stellatum TaxID=574774 RepID=A0A8E2ER70_9PEZI|nr:hypothetical protein AOQ84DRAFT_419449 [Glonium stellatum]